MKFYDTCSLLSLKDYSVLKDALISSKTLEELENIKTSAHKSEDIKFKARQTVKAIKEYEPKIVVVTDVDYSVIKDLGIEITNDNLIIACAKRYSVDNEDVIFVTEDYLCSLIAKSYFNLDVISLDNVEEDDNEYKGYKLISGNTDYINDYMSNIDYSKWFVNEYLIIEDTDTNKFTEMRFNGDSFVSLKLPPSAFVKGKNSLQRCALDLMLNKDITISAVLGGYGSGKTFLATQMALYNVVEKGNQAKILGIRECSGEGKDVGYLKGTFEDKTGRFFKPIEQQLKGGEYELNSLISRGVLETNIPFYLKGTTYNETIMVVDEAEDLTESQIRLIGTRLGENSKIYFSGDYNQSLFNKTQNNPLIKMCNNLKGNSMFGCIVLDDDVRSETSKIFANLFKE